MRRIILACCISLSASIGGYAHDFMVVQNGQQLYFNITDARKQTAEVTFGGSIIDQNGVKPQGEIVIPEKVMHANKTYTVTAVGQKAFANATGLTAVTLPKGIVAIHDFAFENCSSLSKIIFPGNQVKFGQGTFFLCRSIESVTFGSDWTQIDFEIFRWTDKISELTIPAKMDKLYNIYRLKGLKKVNIDANNTRYSSIDGIIYTKQGDVLLACPMAFEGAVKVADGTTTIKADALSACKGITSIDFPASLSRLSFRELGRLPKLESVTFRAPEPIMTAKNKDGEYFVLQTSNPKLKVNVPKSSLKAYKKAIVAKEAEYMVISPNATIPYTVKASELVNQKSFNGVKSL